MVRRLFSLTVYGLAVLGAMRDAVLEADASYICRSALGTQPLDPSKVA